MRRKTNPKRKGYEYKSNNRGIERWSNTSKNYRKSQERNNRDGWAKNHRRRGGNRYNRDGIIPEMMKFECKLKIFKQMNRKKLL